MWGAGAHPCLRVAHYHTIRMATAHRKGGDHIFVRMCALIGVYELGSGSVVPALALYARSFGVS